MAYASQTAAVVVIIGSDVTTSALQFVLSLSLFVPKEPRDANDGDPNEDSSDEYGNDVKEEEEEEEEDVEIQCKDARFGE